MSSQQSHYLYKTVHDYTLSHRPLQTASDCFRGAASFSLAPEAKRDGGPLFIREDHNTCLVKLRVVSGCSSVGFDINDTIEKDSNVMIMSSDI